MGKKPVVRIRVYRGEKLSYNSDGSVQNENHTIALIHGDKEWEITMKTLPISGYCKVEVEKVLERKADGSYDEIKDIEAIEKEVEKAFNPKDDVIKTADQLRIEALEAKIEAMTSGKKNPKKEDKKEDSTDEDAKINEMKVEYEELSGKKPHHMWKEETLVEKIEELKK